MSTKKSKISKNKKQFRILIIYKILIVCRELFAHIFFGDILVIRQKNA